MKLYLFGGAEKRLNQIGPLLTLIKGVIKKIGPQQILHIPFARPSIPPGEEVNWGKGWLEKKLKLKEIEILDARREEDIEKAGSPLIFISGGYDYSGLVNKIRANQKLLDLVLNAEHIIGESAGAMILGGEWQRKGSTGYQLIKGLGILKNTIVEPHYTEKNRQELLLEEMKKAKAQYGIGIDCVTGISFDLKDFPNKYEKIGEGLVEIKKLSQA
jgi:cyanophycinase-like exopeptidase